MFFTATSGAMPGAMFRFSCTKLKEEKKEAPLSMAIGNEELMHEYSKNEIRQRDSRRM